jgi:hypothetical protein
MVNTTQAKVSEGLSARVDFDRFPDVCPICHRGILATLVAAVIVNPDRPTARLQIVFQCPIDGCGNLFVGTYYRIEILRLQRQVRVRGGDSGYYALTEVAPRTAEEQVFNDLIQDLSPNFIEIYNQAITAETMGLTQIVGGGLRKALEFLVKDFVIGQHPDQEEEIRAAFLGNCINQYLEDQNVRECARRAAWLGNDEVHYTRRWEDRDIEDLKRLIRLTVNWIENVLLTGQYVEEMQ